MPTWSWKSNEWGSGEYRSHLASNGQNHGCLKITKVHRSKRTAQNCCQTLTRRLGLFAAFVKLLLSSLKRASQNTHPFLLHFVGKATKYMEKASEVGKAQNPPANWITPAFLYSWGLDTFKTYHYITWYVQNCYRKHKSSIWSNARSKMCRMKCQTHLIDCLDVRTWLSIPPVFGVSASVSATPGSISPMLKANS